MAQFPCLPLWTDAWIADTKHLSRCERGTYHDLLVLMWRTPSCKVPNDNDWLGKHLGMTLAEVVAELRPLLAEFCQTDGNWITQKRLQHEFRRAHEFRGRMSVLRKRRKNKGDGANTERTTPSAQHRSSCTPTPTTQTDRPSSTAATTVDNSEPVAKKQQDGSARSFASAPDEGALAREPDSTPAEPKRSSEKKPVDMTLAEFNEHWRGTGHVNGSAGFKRP